MDNQFMAGQVAMISRGHWIVQSAKRANLNMDIAIPPAKESDTTVIGFGGYAVSKTAADPELALALVSALTSLETQTEEGEGGGGVPGRKAAAETAAFLAFPPSAPLYYQTLPHTLPVPSPANFQEVEKIFIRYYTAMMAGEVSIAEGVKQADAELNASFDAAEEADGRLTRPRRPPGRRGSDCHDRSPRQEPCRPTCGAPRPAPAICSSCRRALLYATFVLAPVVVTAILAFAYYDPMLGSHWVGFDNFTRFFTDHRSLQILWNTLRFALFAVTFNVAVGLLLALALNRAMPGWMLYFFRLAFFLPVIIAAAFVSIVWSYFYADDLGVINYYLRLSACPPCAG